MIEFTSLRFKNFISYSNAWTEYIFEKGITRISGVNGQGKSTIVDAIYYALFGKPFRKTNIPNLVNSKTRKHCCVELNFTTVGYNFRVVRGIKPTRFEIYKTMAGAEWSRKDLIPQDARKKNYQEILEGIFGFNEDIFNQIGIKSLTRYGSFLTLPKGKKRDIIENIFGLEVISEMWELNKLQADETDQRIRDLRRDETNTDLVIEQERKNLDHLKRLKLEMERNIEAENARVYVEVEAGNVVLGKMRAAQEVIRMKKVLVQEYQKQEDEEQRLFTKLNNAGMKIENRISIEEQKIEFVMGYCPACPNLKQMEEDLSLDVLQKGVVDCREKKQVHADRLEELRALINGEQFAIGKEPELVARIEAKERENRRLLSGMKNNRQTAVIIDESQYKAHKEKLAEIVEEIESAHEDLKYYRAIYTVLSDDGIKSFVIKKYLPLLNKLMNTYLQKFGIDLELEFDAELEIEIKTKFKENYAYESFSEGEKKRIDGAMMFTFLEFCKMKHSNASINLLILDEFSSGLDPEGENIMHDILKDIVEKESKEILTISPNPHIDPDKIDRHINVSMRGGFSEMRLVEE